MDGMLNGCRRAMEMFERRNGFTITWEEPPIIAYKWVMTITSDDPRLFAIVQRSMVKLIAPTRSRAITDARELIDFILERVPAGWKRSMVKSRARVLNGELASHRSLISDFRRLGDAAEGRATEPLEAP